jgi:GNAT superfamily N-acetyltransferase
MCCTYVTMNIRLTALVDPAAGPSSRRLAWIAATEDDVPIGSAFLRLFTAAEQAHLAELTLNVHPAHRRRHVGSALLEAAASAAREDGRRNLIARAAAQSPGVLFAAARDFRRVMALIYSRLPLASADLEPITRIVEEPHPGYRLISWDGAVSRELIETFVVARHAMDDMPMGSTDFGAVVWDAERVCAAAAAVQRRGEHLRTVAAVNVTAGTIAGFSELVVPGNGSDDAQHYGTGVLPEHRGHGLGRWMKAFAILEARRRHPRLGGLLTDTADSNLPMRRINDALGYVPTHTSYEYQRDV